MPNELVPVADAAKTIGKSPATIRRWIRAGKITRHEGQTPVHGGSPPAMVVLSEVVAMAGAMGSIRVDAPPVQTARPPGDHQPFTVPDSSPDIADLRVELAIAQGAVQVAQVERDSLERQLEAEREAHRREAAELRHQVDHHRLASKDWQDRYDRAAAELRAVMQRDGLPWWRKLIGTRPELPGEA